MWFESLCSQGGAPRAGGEAHRSQAADQVPSRREGTDPTTTSFINCVSSTEFMQHIVGAEQVRWVHDDTFAACANALIALQAESRDLTCCVRKYGIQVAKGTRTGVFEAALLRKRILTLAKMIHVRTHLCFPTVSLVLHR